MELYYFWVAVLVLFFWLVVRYEKKICVFYGCVFTEIITGPLDISV